jgi:putative (di)nucleoside polyphosphate hydrolase
MLERDEPFSRSLPMTTALPYRPCVGIMLINAAGKVWIGRRPDAANEPEGPGAWWQMPQGVIAESATWHHYDLPVQLRPKAWGGKYQGQKQKWYLARFTGDEREIVLEKPGHKPEFDLWRWADVCELVPLIVPFKRAVYEKVVAEFTPLVKPV